MKQIQKTDRLTQVKVGRKVFMEVLKMKNGKFMSFQHGLGIVSDCESIEICIERSIERVNFMNEGLKKRLIIL